MGSVASIALKHKMFVWMPYYIANDLKDSKVEFLRFNSWSFFIILIISIPEMVLLADSNSLKPNPCIMRHLIIRWSCSTILFRYLHCLIFILEKVRLLNNLIAPKLDPLLSMLMSSGFPLFPMALIKNLCADIRCLLLVKRKSTVFPCFVHCSK